MKPTTANWEFASAKIENFTKPAAGVQAVKVMEANYDKNTQSYTINVWSALNGARFSLRYNMCKVSPVDGSVMPNQNTFRTLNSLAVAVYGPEDAKLCTIPNPDDIIGACVSAEVKLNDYTKTVPDVDESNMPVLNEDGTQKMKEIKRTYANVYEFSPCSAEDFIAYSELEDQYYIKDPDSE